MVWGLCLKESTESTLIYLTEQISKTTWYRDRDNIFKRFNKSLSATDSIKEAQLIASIFFFSKVFNYSTLQTMHF